MDLTSTLERLQISLREGRDVENLLDHPGWQSVVIHLENKALDAWVSLKDADPFSPKEICELQNQIKTYTGLVEEAYACIFDGRNAEESLQSDALTDYEE
jgi:hypothetical protein